MSTPTIIELTLPDGNPLSVVLDFVMAWQPSDDGTLLRFVGGGFETVTESYDAVSEMFNPERQAAC